MYACTVSPQRAFCCHAFTWSAFCECFLGVLAWWHLQTERRWRQQHSQRRLRLLGYSQGRRHLPRPLKKQEYNIKTKNADAKIRLYKHDDRNISKWDKKHSQTHVRSNQIDLRLSGVLKTGFDQHIISACCCATLTENKSAQPVPHSSQVGRHMEICQRAYIQQLHQRYFALLPAAYTLRLKWVSKERSFVDVFEKVNRVHAVLFSPESTLSSKSGAETSNSLTPHEKRFSFELNNASIIATSPSFIIFKQW